MRIWKPEILCVGKWSPVVVAVIALLLLLIPSAASAQASFAPPSRVKKNSDYKQTAKKETITRKAKASTKRKSNAVHRAKTDDIDYEVYAAQPKSLANMSDYELEVEASKGNTDAQYMIGYRWVFSEYEIDLSKGMSWLKAAADRNQSDASALLGFCLYSLGDPNQAGEYYRKSASAGNAAGEYLLGCAYGAGECGMKRDYNKAASLFASAAQKGVPKAQYAIGMYLYLGQGVSRNLEWSRMWMNIAAGNGNKDAQNFLAKMTFNDAAADELLRQRNEKADADGQSASTASASVSESTDAGASASNFASSASGASASASTRAGVSSASDRIGVSSASSASKVVVVDRSIPTEKYLLILSQIELYDDSTVCCWSLYSKKPGVIFSGSEGAYITADGQNSPFKLMRYEGIPAPPKAVEIEAPGTEMLFKAVFPALPATTNTISYYLNDNLYIRNIKLTGE